MPALRFTDWRDWTSPRKLRFWVVVVLSFYTLAGFFLVPWIIRQQAPELSASLLNRVANIGEVRFNPWTFRLEANQLVLQDSATEVLLEIDRLEANLQLSGIFYRALRLAELRLIEPVVQATRYAAGGSNLEKLIAELSDSSATELSPPATEMFRLIVDTLAIEKGRINVLDQTVEQPFQTSVAPIDINISNFSTLRDESGPQSISITLDNSSEVELRGTVQLNPLLVEGSLKLAGSPLPMVKRYLAEMLNFEMSDTGFNTSLDISIEEPSAGDIRIAVDNLDMSLRGFSARTDKETEPLLSARTLGVKGGQIRWPEQSVDIAEIRVEQPVVRAELLADGLLNLAQLVNTPGPADSDAAAADPAADTNTPPAEWQIHIKQLAIDKLSARFVDQTLDTPGSLAIENTNVTLANLANDPDQRASLEIDSAIVGGGAIRLEGDLSLLPELDLTAQINLANLPVNIAQPWAANATSIIINKGMAGLQGNIKIDPNELFAFSGDIVLADVDVSDGKNNESLAGFKTLELKQSRLQLSRRELEISTIDFDTPFARIIIDKNGVSNFQNLTTGESATASAGKQSVEDSNEGAGEPLLVKVGKTTVRNGTVDFSEFDLPLPFRALITEFDGNVAALATNSSKPSKLKFTGKVGEYGQTNVDGEVNLLAPTSQSKVDVRFRNVNMPDLSPYTVEFAGRKIEAGKLDLDLRYTFDERLMQGKNKIVLKSFVLGERVESANAMDLPLDLAVALLRDINGVIDMDVNVSGDLDDPSFSASGIIFKALANLITKVVTAPFTLLASLVPGLGEGEDIGSLTFLAGSSELQPPEIEQLDKLTIALTQRPALKLKVPGSYNAEYDTRALRLQAVETLLAAELDDDQSEQDSEQLTQRMRKALENLARQQIADLDLGELREQFDRSNPETGKAELDEIAYMANIRTLLEARQAISDEQLIRLAESRRQAIMNYLLADAGLANNRIIAIDISKSKTQDDNRVKLDLDIEVGKPDSAANLAGGEAAATASNATEN